MLSNLRIAARLGLGIEAVVARMNVLAAAAKRCMGDASDATKLAVDDRVTKAPKIAERVRQMSSLAEQLQQALAFFKFDGLHLGDPIRHIDNSQFARF